MRKARKFLEAMGEIDDKYIEEARCVTMKKKFSFKPFIAAAACLALMITAYPMAKQFTNISGTGVTATTPETVTKLGASGKFTVLEGTPFDEMPLLNAEHNVEFIIDANGENFVDKEKANTSKTIEIAGKTWTGFYQDSTDSEYYKDDKDNYKLTVDGRDVKFSLNRETGVCTSFFVYNIEGENQTKELTKDECYKIAIAHLSKYINNIEEYELKYEFKRAEGYGYYFMLYRTIDGIMTSERISVGVRENGEIYTHVLHSHGAIGNVDVSGVDMSAMNKALGAKIDTIYKNNYNLEYNAERIVLTRLEDGSYVFDCTMLVEGSVAENGKVYRENCQLIVTAD